MDNLHSFYIPLSNLNCVNLLHCLNHLEALKISDIKLPQQQQNIFLRKWAFCFANSFHSRLKISSSILFPPKGFKSLRSFHFAFAVTLYLKIPEKIPIIFLSGNRYICSTTTKKFQSSKQSGKIEFSFVLDWTLISLKSSPKNQYFLRFTQQKVSTRNWYPFTLQLTDFLCYRKK